MGRNRQQTGHAASDPLAKLYKEAEQAYKSGGLAQAEWLCRQILAANPKHADSLHMMGTMALGVQRPDIAEMLFRQAIEAREDAVFYNSLGNALNAQGKQVEAADSFGRAIAINQNFSDAHFGLANLYRLQEKNDEALKHFERATAIKANPDAHICMGFILQKQERFEDAIRHFKIAVKLMPQVPELLNILGSAYDDLGRFQEAIECYKKALAINPNAVQILNNYGVALRNSGRLDESIPYFRRALDLNPGEVDYTKIMMAMLYAPSCSPEDVANTARDFGQRAAGLLRLRPWVRDKYPERKLRIGYVSPDFRDHPVAYFLEPLLKNFDRQAFEIFAYSTNLHEDPVTLRLKESFDHWRSVAQMSGDMAADVIEADAIDILVDLAGHTAGNGLLIFARKPAPVQATWLGFPATTGLKAMDYRITDIHAEEPGMTERLNVETLWRLPTIFCCYQPGENSPAVIDHPPFDDNGYVTFGCFNNFSKVSDDALKTWARVLARVPDSRLLLEIAHIDEPTFRAETEKRLKACGLPLDQIILEPRRRENQFVLYNRIDIALDPFPCNGGTTSFDTLWMGVPFITMAGEHFTSRMGVTILTNGGLPELIAQTTDGYVELAAGLCGDRDRLRDLRQGLRDKVAASPLMDQKEFSIHMQDAYRAMWRSWCASH